MFGQRFVSVVVATEENKSVASRATVSMVNKQNPILSVKHLHWRQTLLEELQLHNQPHPVPQPGFKGNEILEAHLLHLFSWDTHTPDVPYKCAPMLTL